MDAQPIQTNATEHGERRFDRDAQLYTEKEFEEYYGAYYGPRRWHDAPLPKQPAEANATEHGVENASGSTVQQPSTTTLDVAQGGEATATEHGVQHTNEAIVQQQQLTSTASTLQCPACRRVLCHSSDLAFFHRVNPAGGTEVHLMLKPEIDVPPAFKLAAAHKRGALQTWLCPCGTKLGDTRPVAVQHAPMTAFKSASIMLCGVHLQGKKSKWPAVYNHAPFDHIEVRTRATFFP